LSRSPSQPRPRPQDHAPVGYPEVRDRFLLGADTANSVEWLVAVGRFVQDRWLAEERTREKDQALDEGATGHLWDECTERQLVELRANAILQLREYSARHWENGVRAYWRRTFKPVKGIIAAIRWLLVEMVRGLIGGIGLIILGLMFLALQPGTVKHIRTLLNDLLPESTSPAPPPKTNASNSASNSN
jgi:hypothetical protein